MEEPQPVFVEDGVTCASLGVPPRSEWHAALSLTNKSRPTYEKLILERIAKMEKVSLLATEMKNGKSPLFRSLALNAVMEAGSGT